ncbi:ribosome biogenesis protein NOP53-like isoform X1 [Asterias amurensis]|uniref:ribosome biogenesis protein NOP53-like isoform X1 n=2 Tax=Asterias amurensis TaxID=7602 RepID=UPI003AB83B3D
MTSVPAAKRKRVAMNRKKAWRKYSNIQDVEDFLEEQRQQLRTGGLASEKSNEALFFEDKTAHRKGQKKTASKSTKPRGPIQHKVDLRIRPHPRVPPIPKALPRQERRKSSRVLQIQAQERKGIYSENKQKRLDEAKQQRTLATGNRKREKELLDERKATFDLWDCDMVKKIKKSGIEADEHFLRQTKKTPAKLPPRYQDKPSKFPAVEIIAPGASYNPSLEDHQDLVNATYEIELKKQKAEEKLDRWHKIPKLSAKQAQATYIDEMSAGLFHDDENQKGDPEDVEGEKGLLPNPPTTFENRKTKKRKRKERALKEKEKEMKAEKRLKIRQNEVYRLRSIAKEMEKEKADAAIEREKRLQREKEREKIPKSLGHHKLEEEPMVIKLSDELVGSLRQLKPEGNLLRDRYKSLQKRNIIESRVWKRGGKAKYKEYEKKSHKEITS